MSAQSTDISTVSRRGFLQAGFLALGGLGLADLLRLRAAAAGNSSQDTSIILIWLQGGPSHMETYDLKPDAPLDYRGLMDPIRTSVDGMDVCELLPLHAKVADKFTIIRSISHGFAIAPEAMGDLRSGIALMSDSDGMRTFTMLLGSACGTTSSAPSS